MRLKIRGGTVQHGEPSLCLTCRHATIVKGQGLRDEIVQCDRLSAGHDLIRFPVTFCTGYSDRRHPSLREMEDLAWIATPSLDCGTLASAGRSPLPARFLTVPS